MDVTAKEYRLSAIPTRRLREQSEAMMQRILGAETEGEREDLRRQHKALEQELRYRPPLVEAVLTEGDFDELKRIEKMPMGRRSAQENNFLSYRLNALIAGSERGAQLVGELEQVMEERAQTDGSLVMGSLAWRLDNILRRYHVFGTNTPQGEIEPIEAVESGPEV